MVDVIAGARYWDPVVQQEAVCKGVTSEGGEPSVAKLEYENASEPCDVPYHLLRDNDTVELVELP